MKTDILIIGTGLSGLATTLELLDLPNFSKKITLIDSRQKEEIGGLAREAFGGVFMVDSPQQKRMGIKDSTELAIADWESFAQFKAEDQLLKNWSKQFVEYSHHTLPTWLKKHSVGFFPVVHWVERGLYLPGNSVPRFHMVWGTGLELTNKIIGKIISHKKNNLVEFNFGHKASDFLIENQVVKGIKGIKVLANTEKNNESEKTSIHLGFEIKADITVLATGGFTGNLERVRKEWPKSWGTPPEIILNGSHPSADGLLLDKVKVIGGKVKNLSNMWHYAAGIHNPLPNRPDHGLSLVPPRSALWVDRRGKRIGPIPLMTSFDTRHLVKSICQLDKQYSWQILNWKIAVKELAVSGAEYNPAIRDKKLFSFLKTILFGNKSLVNKLVSECEDFVLAGSISELAEKMSSKNFGHSIQALELENEIKKYDQRIERGPSFHNDDQLRRISQLRKYRGDKPRTSNFQKILDKKAFPLIAIREFILSRKSLGGIQTDLQGRVLTGMVDEEGQREGQTLKGLYAVGEAAGFGGGGVHGKRSLEGTFLGGCLITGIIAAKSISKNI